MTANGTPKALGGVVEEWRISANSGTFKDRESRLLLACADDLAGLLREWDAQLARQGDVAWAKWLREKMLGVKG